MALQVVIPVKLQPLNLAKTEAIFNQAGSASTDAILNPMKMRQRDLHQHT